MTNRLLIATVLCLLLPQASFANPERAPLAHDRIQAKIAAEVRAALAELKPGEMLTVLVTLRASAELDRAAQAAGESRAVRLQRVIAALQATAGEAQKPVRALLADRQSKGLAGPATYFWIFDGVSVTATGEVIAELAARPDVLKIAPNAIHIVPAALPAAGSPEPNLSIVNAPALWDLGWQGQGIVVANMDSGVDVSHPELSARWRGGTNSWLDPYNQHPLVPADLSGHGTVTMGVMVGGDAGGTAIGVAPGAQWIAVKIWNDAGGATATALHQGFQWLLDPDGNPATADAPHVVNNSWAFGAPGCNLDFEPDLEALRAAGILPVFSAGNYGPGSATSPSPPNNPAAFAVGATDDADAIYAYSSRGPSSCGEPETVFPELVAPGVNIRTTGLNGTYSDATGTSLAAPHVAGGLALLLSAYPNMPVAMQEQALLGGAVDLGVSGPDNVYGYGRLDLLDAYLQFSQGANLSLELAGVADTVDAGSPLTYTLLVTNLGPDAATGITVTDELPPEVTFDGISAMGWACGHTGQVVTCTLPVLEAGPAPAIRVGGVAPATSTPITNTAWVTSTTADPWLPNNRHVQRTQVILPEADLSISLVDDPDPVGAGAALTYTLWVTNAGPVAATAISLTITLAPAVTLGSVAGDGWACSDAGETITCTRASLSVGTAPAVRIGTSAPPVEGTLTSSASVLARESDPHPDDNVVAATTRVGPVSPARRRLYLPLIVR